MTDASPASFRDALERGLASGDLAGALRSFRALSSVEDARALVAALDRMPGDAPQRGSGPLHVVAALYQSAEDERLVAVLREGFPRFIALYDRTLAALRAPRDDSPPGKTTSDLLFALKIFSMWPNAGGPEALRRVLEAARDPSLRDGYLWSVVFNIYASPNHPRAMDVAARLASAPPTEGFAAVAFVDFVNTLCRDGRLKVHPYATDEGVAWLEGKLRDRENPSYGHTATAALPFLPPAARARLFELARAHEDLGVRMEAAWADARLGGTAGIFQLVGLCRDPHATMRAQTYLRELGRAEAIPQEARERNFVAMAEMSQWLQHPNEFGAAPDELVLYDTRELHWPPTNDKRRVWLFRYAYEKPCGREGQRRAGLGMVGSITFALAGETTESLSPEDAYAIHCCWELQMKQDPRAPKERSVANGRRLLGFG